MDNFNPGNTHTDRNHFKNIFYAKTKPDYDVELDVDSDSIPKDNNIVPNDRTIICQKSDGSLPTNSAHDVSTPDSTPVMNGEKVKSRDFSTNLQIMRNNSHSNDNRILYPIRPFHKRLSEYIKARERIFQDKLLGEKLVTKYRRSTVRMRDLYKRIKRTKKLFISSIFSNSKDGRLYAGVEFLDRLEIGLLDTGANVSCIGADLATEDFSKERGFKKLRSTVETADGQPQLVLGELTVEMKYKNEVRKIVLYVVPTLHCRLILGLDFWKTFGLITGVISGLTIENSSIATNQSPADDEAESCPLTSMQRQQLEAVKLLYPSFERQGLGRTGMIKHEIDVGSAKPVKQRFYPVSPAVEKLLYKEVDRMLSLNVIEPSQSAWSSPMRMVIKPGKVRLCLDARKINYYTKKDAYPLPSIEGIFARLPKANFISKIDLKDAYWQIELDENSKSVTAFTIPGRPLYQFTVMPFGLCNAPQTMCRLMDEIIPPDLKNCVFGYLDDVCVVSDTFDSHLSILVRLAEQFKKANLTLNIDKSRFCVRKVKYLGYIIGEGGIATDPGKIESILNWPVPRNFKQVRGFLGLAGWYRRFIENFADVTFPITEVLSKKKLFVWPETAQVAFDKVKQLLTTAPVLRNPDFKKKFFVHCDASDFGIGAVLVQLDEEGQEGPIAFMSRKLNSAQRNYSVTEKECLAAIEAIERFRCYLELQEFEVITDHSSLVWLMRQPNLKGRLARWALKLQGYKFTISHRKGKENVVPDALSRIPDNDNEIYSVELVGPEVDLDSVHFLDHEYVTLRNNVLKDQASFPDIKVIDNFIYIRTKHASGGEEDQNLWKLWIPKPLRNEILKRSHDSVIASHGGIAKTVELIRRNFYWPGLVSHVREYIRKCDTCKTTKATNQILKPEMGNMSVSVRPFQRLYIDMLGPYPRSKKGFLGLLIILDHFSKYHWLCPLKKFTSEVIIEFLEKNIFHMVGVPEIIISDNGSQFKAKEFNLFLNNYGIQHQYTAIYSPQSNASERVNRSIIAAIRAYLKKDHRDWDQNLSSISCALRNACHQSIGCTPYKALYGFNMITHGTSYKLLRSLDALEDSEVPLNREDHLLLLRNDIQQKLEKAYETNVKQYNLRARPISFEVGDEVFHRNFVQSDAEKKISAKLCPVFIKSKVIQKIGNCMYLLEDSDGKTAKYHAKDIRK